MRIGIDILGGDYAPGSVLNGAILARESLPVDTEIIFIGDQNVITRYSEEHLLDVSGFSVVDAKEAVAMDDHPLKAFREKPRAGLFLGQRLLADGSLDGFCSAGNTGAMRVGAMQISTSIPGIIRPAIGAPIPNVEGKHLLLLDVGLNPDARPEVLYQ